MKTEKDCLANILIKQLYCVQVMASYSGDKCKHLLTYTSPEGFVEYIVIRPDKNYIVVSDLKEACKEFGDAYDWNLANQSEPTLDDYEKALEDLGTEIVRLYKKFVISISNKLTNHIERL